MTAFNKANFSYHGGYLTYEGKFVARFKHVPANKPGFLKFLIANFTTEEYFAAREKNDNSGAPVCILEAKGYVPTHILKWLRDGKLAMWKNKPAAAYAAQFPKVRAPRAWRF